MEDEAEARFVDYRFLLANERTFLAWIRTSLGIVAGGVALDQFVRVQQDSRGLALLAICTIFLGAAVAVIGTARWSRADTMMRRHLPMRRSRGVVIVGACVAIAAVLIALLLWLT